jgi:hypothetical protein
MNGTQSITILQYYRSFKSLSGALVGFFSALPVFSGLLPSAYSAYAFPPLGSIEGPARVGIMVLAFAATYCAFFAISAVPARNRRRITTAFFFALVSLCLYLGLFLRFVRIIDVPAKGVSVAVSVGYDRTDFARATFGTGSDWDLLRGRGVDDEQVWKLWTAKSILIARMSLYFAYCLIILSLVAAFSWGVLCEPRL